jgi:hypothetical protein
MLLFTYVQEIMKNLWQPDCWERLLCMKGLTDSALTVFHDWLMDYEDRSSLLHPLVWYSADCMLFKQFIASEVQGFAMIDGCSQILRVSIHAVPPANG